MNARNDRFLIRPRLLLVDGSKAFCAMLLPALEEHGFSVTVCHDATQAFAAVSENPLEYVVTDLKLPDMSGLTLVSRLKVAAPLAKIVVLTGHACIATAVEAIKLGATHYLLKPSDAAQIVAAFSRDAGDDSVPVINRPLSLNRLEHEYINWILTEYSGNLSAAARALSMHRRTLQRKLFKRAKTT